MLTLAIGDFHIPERAAEIPPKFHRLLSSSSSANKIQKVVCLGNITSSPSSLEFVESISSDFELIKGEFDEDLSLPLSVVYKIEGFKVGVISGFSVIPQNDPLSLLTQARMMDVDILIWGGSSKVEAYTLDGKFFINPGSATGAMGFNGLDKEELEMIESELASTDVAAVNTAEQGEASAGNTTSKADGEQEDNEPSETPGDEKADEPKEEAEAKDEVPDDGEVKAKLLEELISPVPSFCLLDIKGSLCVTYIYTLIDNEIKIDKINYRKE